MPPFLDAPCLFIAFPLYFPLPFIDVPLCFHCRSVTCHCLQVDCAVDYGRGEWVSYGVAIEAATLIERLAPQLVITSRGQVSRTAVGTMTIPQSCFRCRSL